MNDDKVHIVLASDANYMPGLEVTRTSILRSCFAPERLAWHVFDETALDGLDDLDVFDRYNTSKMPYLRLFLPELLPEVDYVVYSDVDTIWNRDVCELWDETIGKREDKRGCEEPSIYWVRDLLSMRHNAAGWIDRVSFGEGNAFDWTRYACSGVCVMNLKKMREERMTERAVRLVREFGTPSYADQDVLNVLFNHDSVLLPSVWNAMGDCSNLPKAGERCVYHLTGVGRHFHDKTPPTYPPQYALWWRVYNAEKQRNGVARYGAPLFLRFSVLKYRLLAALWPLHPLANLLPLRLRERIVRQWFFAKVLCRDVIGVK